MDKNKIIVVGSTICIVALIILFGIYVYNIRPVSKDSGKKEFEVASGESYLTIDSLLKENNFIKSPLFYKIYIKINSPKPLEACTYYLSENMGVKGIVNTLSKGCKSSPENITITFKEGLNMRKMAKIISENTNNTLDDVFNLLKNKKYLDGLINKYWFLSNEIKNDKIYYSLEGYLFPNTYQFANKDVTIEEIFGAMLDEMDKQLKPFKDSIEKSEFTVHEFLTLASIIELEGASSDDRSGVAGVFYNRLNDDWALGSDVTTYYAVKIDMSDRDLYQSELDDYNAYNTRNSNLIGLPVSPICNPGIDSIIATNNPKKHDFYYFVADKNKKTYFMSNENEHNKKINELREKGLWFEYED